MFRTYIILTTILQFIASTIGAQPNYDHSRMQKEKLGRGVVAIRSSESQVMVSWRYLSSDPANTGFNVYRDGRKVNDSPVMIGTMYFDDYSDDAKAEYEVRADVNGKEEECGGKYVLGEKDPVGYIEIPLRKPDDGITPAGDVYSYCPNDATVADVDGDGEYEIIIKWQPDNAHDNSHDGYTGPVLMDCYRLDGEFLWRINLGVNIRAGAHYNPFIVYDLDGDGKAELVMRTSDGTIDGKGMVIGDANADYREPGYFDQRRDKLRNQGRILTGNEYLTVFSGLTGEALYNTYYMPERGDPKKWGDSFANRSDRFLATVAYLDGVRPSVVICRGYYSRTVLAAYDWDGQALTSRWIFDSDIPGNEDYAGQGNHNLRVADVDGDGCDEIIYGQCAINNDGTGLYSTKMGHGDAIHLTKFSPDMQGLQVWACHENKKDGSTFRNAATGEVIFQIPSGADVGRCLAADIDPTNPGLEMWSTHSAGIRNTKGVIIAGPFRKFPSSMAVWWDGDLLRELLSGNVVNKYDWENKKLVPIMAMEGTLPNNGSKATPCLQGDIIGDWREEIVMRTEDNSAIRIYVSTIPTRYRFHTFMEDPVYRISVANQNIGYNQPTQPGFYFGSELKGWFRGYDFGE